MPEDDPGARERVDLGAGGTRVAVGAEAIGAQRVDEQEDDVQILALAQLRDLRGAALRPRRPRDLELAREREHEQQRRADEVGPGRVQQLAQHPRASPLRGVGESNNREGRRQPIATKQSGHPFRGGRSHQTR